MKIRECTIDVAMPITENKAIQLDGVLSFSLHNAGTSNAMIDGGFTLLPGSTLQMGMPDANVVISDKIRVSFASGGTNKLELIVQRMKGAQFSNYEKQAL